MLAAKQIEDLKEILLSEHRSETELNKLKTLFKENEFLKTVPSSLRAEFCAHMYLKEVPALQSFIKETEKKPDFYMVLKGKLILRNRTKETTLTPFEIFGCTKQLDSKKWIPSRCTAKEATAILYIPREEFKNCMEKVGKINDDARVLQVLIRTVPGLKRLGQAGKQRVLNYFEKVSFKAGDTLLKQGEHASYAFIIEEGECKQVNKQNPVQRPGSAITRGFMSKTTSCYHLGIASSGEWVGEDSVLLEKPMEFSVIANTYVKTLRITKEKLRDNLTRETVNALKKCIEDKASWRNNRKDCITKIISKNVYEEEDEFAVCNYENTEKNYPTASKLALNSIRRREMIKSERESRKKLENNQESPYGLVRASSRPNSKRPVSSYTKRPSSSYSTMVSPSKRTIPNNSFVPENSPNKVKLYSAFTLGYSLVPVLPVKSKMTSSATPLKASPRKVEKVDFSYEIKGNQKLTYAQMVRKGRPNSPNPAEVWARKHNVELECFRSKPTITYKSQY